MEEIIKEIKILLETQIAIDTDNPIEEQYKSRTICNYTAALKNLIDIKRLENGKS